MSKYAVITIDTESDHDKRWHKTKPLKFESVLHGIPQILQPLFSRYGAKPTYLLAMEVIESDKCAECLRSLSGEYELGTHLHPEYVEPDKKYLDYENTLSKDFACYLDPEEEFLKIRTITEAFIKRFGYAPLSYRAGRFAAGCNTIRSLEKLGYKVDTSIAPYSFWNGYKNSIDFTGYPDHLYFPSPDNIREEGNSAILEVPITIKPRRYLSKEISSIIEKAYWLKDIPLLSRFIYKLLCPVWLEPSFSSTGEMIAVVEDTIDSNKDGMVVANIMFHSMEIIAGASPMAATDRKVSRILYRLDRFLAYLKDRDFQFIRLSELYDKKKK